MTAFRPRFLLIAVMLILLTNYPLLSISNKAVFIAGIPVLYAYLGLVWLIGIGLLYFTGRKLPKEVDE